MARLARLPRAAGTRLKLPEPRQRLRHLSRERTRDAGLAPSHCKQCFEPSPVSARVPFVDMEALLPYSSPPMPCDEESRWLWWDGTAVLVPPWRGFEEGCDGERLLSGFVCPCTQVNWLGSPRG